MPSAYPDGRASTGQRADRHARCAEQARRRFALTTFGQSNDGTGRIFLIAWTCGVVAITGLNTWAAFSEKGSLATFTRVPEDDGRAR